MRRSPFTVHELRSLTVVVVVVAALATVASGCGYALAGRGSFLPADIRTVGIPKLDNRSSVFQVEDIITEKVRAEFIGRGKYAVIPDAVGADAVLTGEISSISLQPVGLNDQQRASRYLFTVALRVQFADARTSEVLWSNEALVFREEYELPVQGGSDGLAFLDQERSTMDRIAGDVARSVVTSILEAF